MTFLLSFFNIIATLVTAYLKILAPLLAIYLIIYQLASLFYSQLPSILSYYIRGTTISNNALYEKCERAALGAQLNRLDKAPPVQTGVIVFNFKLK